MADPISQAPATLPQQVAPQPKTDGFDLNGIVQKIAPKNWLLTALGALAGAALSFLGGNKSLYGGSSLDIGKLFSGALSGGLLGLVGTTLLEGLKKPKEPVPPSQ